MLSEVSLVTVMEVTLWSCSLIPFLIFPDPTESSSHPKAVTAGVTAVSPSPSCPPVPSCGTSPSSRAGGWHESCQSPHPLTIWEAQPLLGGVCLLPVAQGRSQTAMENLIVLGGPRWSQGSIPEGMCAPSGSSSGGQVSTSAPPQAQMRCCCVVTWPPELLPHPFGTDPWGSCTRSRGLQQGRVHG